MEIIAHRGIWKREREKNTIDALVDAIREGFGIETDIRDYSGKLVISHNVADEGSPLAETFLSAYKDGAYGSTLALNIKADGLQPLLIPLLEKYEIKNYFLFDMSVPETVVNDAKKLTYYTRSSDIEHECVLYESAAGVWVDSYFDDSWPTMAAIKKHLDYGKKVCLVSPELHNRAYQGFWEEIKRSGLRKSDFVALCTDKPVLAREYFYGQ